MSCIIGITKGVNMQFKRTNFIRLEENLDSYMYPSRRIFIQRALNLFKVNFSMLRDSPLKEINEFSQLLQHRSKTERQTIVSVGNDLTISFVTFENKVHEILKKHFERAGFNGTISQPEDYVSFQDYVFEMPLTEAIKNEDRRELETRVHELTKDALIELLGYYQLLVSGQLPIAGLIVSVNEDRTGNSIFEYKSNIYSDSVTSRVILSEENYVPMTSKTVIEKEMLTISEKYTREYFDSSSISKLKNKKDVFEDMLNSLFMNTSHLNRFSDNDIISKMFGLMYSEEITLFNKDDKNAIYEVKDISKIDVDHIGFLNPVIGTGMVSAKRVKGIVSKMKQEDNKAWEFMELLKELD